MSAASDPIQFRCNLLMSLAPKDSVVEEEQSAVIIRQSVYERELVDNLNKKGHIQNKNQELEVKAFVFNQQLHDITD